MTLEAFGWNDYFARHLAALTTPGLLPGRVCRATRGYYTLRTESGEVPAGLPGKLRREEVPVVGDWVAFVPAATGQTVQIQALLPRRTCFARVAPGRRQGRGAVTELQVLAANLDTVLVVCGLDRDFNLRRIERYLTLAWESGAQPVIVLNKADLSADPEAQRTEVESIAGEVPIHLLAAKAGTGLDILRTYLAPGRTVALLGSSGVGKSTLLNRLAGSDLQQTGAVSEALGKGMHTTSHRELFLLPGGGLVVDNPGMRELQLWGEGEGVAETFEEIASLACHCRFGDCRHDGEPGCAVLAAVAEGELGLERLASYRRQRTELAAFTARATSGGEAEHRRKWKAIHKGLRRMLKERKEE